MACEVDYRFGVALAERLHVAGLLCRFLHMGERQLGDLLTDKPVVSVPAWRFRLVKAFLRTLLKLWPERLFCLIGRGEELCVTAVRKQS